MTETRTESGNTNDRNTARTFVSDPVRVSEITIANINLISRLKTIVYILVC